MDEPEKKKKKKEKAKRLLFSFSLGNKFCRAVPQPEGLILSVRIQAARLAERWLGAGMLPAVSLTNCVDRWSKGSWMGSSSRFLLELDDQCQQDQCFFYEGWLYAQFGKAFFD